MVKSTPLTVVVVLLLIAHNVYTLYIMRLAVERPVGPSNGEKQVFTSGRIAVVRPFIPSHVDRLVEDMASWERPEFRPCALPAGNDDGDRPDLVLYFSYPLDQFPEVVSTLQRAWAAAAWSPCFAEMRIISAGLDPAADRYLPSQKTAESAKDEAEAEEAKPPAPSGVVLMYFNLMLDPAFGEAYEYFLYMEPDLTAVRAGWLDQFSRECHDELHNFWMKGSIYAGPKYVSDETDSPWLFHINGNAIYHVGDPGFRDYIKKLRQLEGALTNPFDVTMYEFRRQRFTLSQRTIHRFLYGEYIQNYGVSGYSLRQLLVDKPRTFLVHKKHNCPECDPVEP
ncbi:uncharacterized protein ACA1_070020 [Acanthamoeba castellanii str. Neff]|uniref:Uncharacterized protein n=1 Tax=Acanthamoeba castellanii (strain ATCC 30010 / Neff) TaxID=1257118 RepID=L8HG38_ACACF|nr:uncharacterized protein ACA1_070020 [Acanthamoeba castellanii str. Neff]ELR23416.1 hypothetical protein ACA1_070020 [Acanthamoeba castellanii str. Neff]